MVTKKKRKTPAGRAGIVMELIGSEPLLGQRYCGIDRASLTREERDSVELAEAALATLGIQLARWHASRDTAADVPEIARRVFDSVQTISTEVASVLAVGADGDGTDIT